MTNFQIALLELATVGGIGLLVALSGLLASLFCNKRNASCTSATEGTVVGYRFRGEMNFGPVVEFTAQGKTYRTVKKFNGVKSLRLPLPQKPSAHEDEKGYLHVTHGPVVNVRALAESLWPMGSTQTVYYNPKKPKVNFVERGTKNKIYTIIATSLGSGVMLLSILLFFVIKQG